MLQTGGKKSKNISLPYCEIKKNLLYYDKKLVVPEKKKIRLDLLKKVYKAPAGGHYSAGKTLGLLRRQY